MNRSAAVPRHDSRKKSNGKRMFEKGKMIKTILTNLKEPQKILKKLGRFLGVSALAVAALVVVTLVTKLAYSRTFQVSSK
ncbi:MAG: hypothetical protein SNJ81_00705 [Cyanobacteriota bacterium]